MNIPAICFTNAKKNGLPVKAFQDKEAKIVMLVYPNGKVDGPFSESDADDIIKASKDFKKKQESWSKNHESRLIEIRHKVHQFNQFNDSRNAQTSKKIVSSILRSVTR